MRTRVLDSFLRKVDRGRALSDENATRPSFDNFSLYERDSWQKPIYSGAQSYLWDL